MELYNNKGTAMTFSLVITLVLVLVFLVIDATLFNDAKNAVDETEFLECRASIDIAHSITLDKKFLGINAGIQPIPFVCKPLIISDEVLNKADDEREVAKAILEKMRVAWWATGRGQYEDIWKDSGSNDKLCKVMYYFSLDEEGAGTKLVNNGITASRFKTVYLEREKLSKIDATLSNYLAATSGTSNKYHVLLESNLGLDPNGMLTGIDTNNENDVIAAENIYAIIISSDRNGNNELILANVPPGDFKTKQLEFINEKFKQLNPDNTRDDKLCTEMVEFDDVRMRAII